VITEDFRSLGRSKNPLVSACAGFLTGTAKRFSPADFEALIAPYRERIRKKTEIVKGREVMVVFDTRGFN